MRFLCIRTVQFLTSYFTPGVILSHVYTYMPYHAYIHLFLMYISFLYFPELHTHRLSEITYYCYLRRISRLRSLNQRYCLAHILMYVKTVTDENVACNILFGEKIKPLKRRVVLIVAQQNYFRFPFSRYKTGKNKISFLPISCHVSFMFHSYIYVYLEVILT